MTFSVTMGADPEVFLFRGKKPVPAHRFYGTQADESLSRDDDSLEAGGFVFRDGFAAEINVLPTYCREMLAKRLLDQLYSIKEKTKLKVSLLPTIPIVPKRDLMDAPPDVLEVGCSPVFNAYDPKPTPRKADINLATHPYRYAGGHLHFSIGSHVRSLDIHDPAVIRILDWKLGVPMSIIFDSPLQYQRREYFGKAGEYRPTRHGAGCVGLEYRVLGPEWLCSSIFVSLAFGIGRYLLLNLEEQKKGWTPSLGLKVRRAINTGRGLWDVFSPVFGLNEAILRKLSNFPRKYSPMLRHNNGFLDWCFAHGFEV